MLRFGLILLGYDTVLGVQENFKGWKLVEEIKRERMVTVGCGGGGCAEHGL